MLLKDLFKVVSGNVTIYIGNKPRPIYQGYYGCAPEELLTYKITKIASSHYYPYFANDEKVDCLDIELIEED